MPTMPTIPPELLRLMMTQGGLVLALLSVYVIFKVMMLRMTINGKVGCYFQEANGNMTFELIKYQREARDSAPVLVSRTDDLGYGMEVTMQRRILYPAGGWRF